MRLTGAKNSIREQPSLNEGVSFMLSPWKSDAKVEGGEVAQEQQRERSRGGEKLSPEESTRGRSRGKDASEAKMP